MASLSEIQTMLAQIDTLPDGPDKQELLAAANELYQQFEAEGVAREAQAKSEAETYGAGGALAEQALNKLTAGHGAEIQGAIAEALPTSVRSVLNAPLSEALDVAMSDKKTLKDLEKYAGPGDYTEARDLAEARLKGYEATSPIASTVGKGIGIVAGARGMGRLLPVGAPQSAMEAVKQGLLMGSVSGAMEDPGSQVGEISPLQAKERALQAAMGAGTGALLSPAIYGIGQKMYKQGFSQVLNKAKSMRKDPDDVLKTLRDNKIYGTAAQVEQQADDVAQMMKNAKDEIIDTATAQGGKVPKLGSELQKLSDDLDVVIKGKNEAAAREAMKAKEFLDAQILRVKSTPEQIIETVKPTGILDSAGNPLTKVEVKKIAAKNLSPTIKEADEIKTSLQRNADWREIAQSGDAGSRAQKAMEKIARVETEEAVGQTFGQEAKTLLKKTNKNLGNLLTVKDVMARQTANEANKMSGGAVLGMAAAANPMVAAGKLVGDQLRTSRFLTGGGYKLANDPLATMLGIKAGMTGINAYRSASE